MIFCSGFFVHEDQQAAIGGKRYLPNAIVSALEGSSQFFVVLFAGKYFELLTKIIIMNFHWTLSKQACYLDEKLLSNVSIFPTDAGYNFHSISPGEETEKKLSMYICIKTLIQRPI